MWRSAIQSRASRIASSSAISKGSPTGEYLLAVASKNNPEDAREPFDKNPDMVLRLDDLAAIEASGNRSRSASPGSRRRSTWGWTAWCFSTTTRLNVSRSAKPCRWSTVVDVPADPADYISGARTRALVRNDGDHRRRHDPSQQYAIERQRRELRTGAASLDDYLESLDMVADVQALHEGDLARVWDSC